MQPNANRTRRRKFTIGNIPKSPDDGPAVSQPRRSAPDAVRGGPSAVVERFPVGCSLVVGRLFYCSSGSVIVHVGVEAGSLRSLLEAGFWAEMLRFSELFAVVLLVVRRLHWALDRRHCARDLVVFVVIGPRIRLGAPVRPGGVGEGLLCLVGRLVWVGCVVLWEPGSVDWHRGRTCWCCCWCWGWWLRC